MIRKSTELVNCGASKYFFATFSEKLQQRQSAQAGDEYKKEIEFLSSKLKPTFSMIDFRQRTVDGLQKIKKGLKYKFASGIEQTQQQMQSQKTIMNAMFDEELLNPSKMTGEKKKDIAMVAQVTVQDVNTVLQHYKSMENLHKWIRSKKEKNEPLPENAEEMQYRFRLEKPMSKSFLKFDYQQPQYSMKQRLQKVKWGHKKKV